jgi:hypothetical protein
LLRFRQFPRVAGWCGVIVECARPFQLSFSPVGLRYARIVLERPVQQVPEEAEPSHGPDPPRSRRRAVVVAERPDFVRGALRRLACCSAPDGRPKERCCLQQPRPQRQRQRSVAAAMMEPVAQDRSKKGQKKKTPRPHPSVVWSAARSSLNMNRMIRIATTCVTCPTSCSVPSSRAVGEHIGTSTSTFELLTLRSNRALANGKDEISSSGQVSFLAKG